MGAKLWGHVAIAACLFATTHGWAGAPQQGELAAASGQEVVESCFSHPQGATEIAIVSATFGPDGSLKAKPEIIRKGEGPLNNAFANAAVRAILKCGPRLADLGLQGKLTFNFVPPGLPPATHASLSIEALAPERLDLMKNAADQLKKLIERRTQSGASLHPTSPDIAKLLAPLCNAGEAATLPGSSTEKYALLSRYARYVSTVMEVYSDIADRSSQHAVTQHMRALGSCVDTVLWSNRAVIEMTRRIFSESPDLLDDPKAKNIRENIQFFSEQVIAGVLEAFRLKGIGPAWCEARLAALVALMDVATPTMSSQQRRSLREAVRLAQSCGPEAKLGLQPVYNNLER